MSGKVLGTEAFDGLITLLSERGYTVIAPTLREQAIVYGEVTAADQLPIGWTDEQEAGSYRLRRRDDNAYFGYTVGPRTLKSYLFPPRQTLLTIEHAETGLRFCPRPPDPRMVAFVGVRACEIAAVGIQDKVFNGERFADPHYRHCPKTHHSQSPSTVRSPERHASAIRCEPDLAVRRVTTWWLRKSSIQALTNS